MSNFWKSILSSKDTTSSKRLVTMIISGHFIVASFAILFIAFYVIFYLPKGKVETELLNMLKQVLEYDFYIILSGLGFITADNMGQILLEKAKFNMSNQPPKVLVAPKDSKITPISGDDLIIEPPASDDIEVTISKSNKPE